MHSLKYMWCKNDKEGLYSTTVSVGPLFGFHSLFFWGYHSFSLFCHRSLKSLPQFKSAAACLLLGQHTIQVDATFWIICFISNTIIRRKKRQGWETKWQWKVCFWCPTLQGWTLLRVTNMYAFRQLGYRLLQFDQTGGFRYNSNPKTRWRALQRVRW